MLLNCRQRTYKIGFQKNFDHLLQPVEARRGYVINCKTIVLFGSGPGVDHWFIVMGGDRFL